jgi:hypothetical protein
MLNLLKKGSIGCAALFAVLALTVPCRASVVGEWSVSGTCTAKATLTGGPTETLKMRVQDHFTFYANKKFHMIGINGTWRMKVGRFVIYLNAASIEKTVEDLLDAQGLNAELDITSLIFGGKQDGAKITGNLTLKANFRVIGSSKKGTITVSWPFTGKRLPASVLGGEVESAAESFSQRVQESLPRVLLEEAAVFDSAPGEPSQPVQE